MVSFNCLRQKNIVFNWESFTVIVLMMEIIGNIVLVYNKVCNWY